MNFFRILISYLASRFKWVFKTNSLPFFLSIEPSDFCQLQCPECPVGVNKRNQGTNIDFELYKNIIDELKSTLFHLILYFQGEPLLNKNLTNMIAYAHKSRIFTSTSTNAQLINSELAREIVESGLDKLIISMDGATQEVYEKYRIGGKLALAIKGVEEVYYWKKQLKSETPFIEIQFIVLKTNEHQLKEIKQLSNRLNVNRLTFKTAQLYDFENGHSLLTSINKYTRYKLNANGKYEIKSKLKNRCFRLWSGAVISAKGDFLPCCFDKNGIQAFGNLNTDSFSAISNSKKAFDFKTSILQNRKQYEMCRNCTSK
ncbi:MAG: radical SAM/SPASM domain-containing protein [Paludibacter sp.]